ncbi:uncharacterized protein LOC113230602 isoform X1 [Hyposmocoma kahamanoa]|uniref:uncharacterized protein LOC113230602 isoform X1 n=1 Tax=Hyposmocoma kahamanoa TaxID=1477025 RepID=UPI000E6D5E38|nr:uncharacterized protein LOC113230602 isoform X1 [Hyposmocoma kahamanoa]XP_026320388.1 uncharacterized protein LOC113230602 isoform X1 [Hyposmocoma kahamanoa]
MATKVKSDYPTSPQNGESDEEEKQDPESNTDVEDTKPAKTDVAELLKRLQSTGALLKQPKKEHRCHTCNEDFPNWEDLENHLFRHVSLPSVVLDKLPSDDEDVPPSGDDNWSDEEDDVPDPPQQKTPQKIDISQLMKKGLIKASPQKQPNSDSALSKLSGLGFTIKKGSTPIKQEKTESEPQSTSDVMQKLGNLGGIKLKLKSDGGNTNSFKVINGLKDFKTSDDEEDEGSGNEEPKEEQMDSGEELEKDPSEHESGDDQEQITTKKEVSDYKDSSDEEVPLAIEKANKKIASAIKTMQTKLASQKEQVKKQITHTEAEQPPLQPNKPGKPAMKQTPKRGATLPVSNPIAPTQGKDISTTSADRRDSRDTNTDNVTVKKEVEDSEPQSSSGAMPLFSGQIKSERTSPVPTDSVSTPIISEVKTEPGATPVSSHKVLQNTVPSSTTTSNLLPVTKTEDTEPTIIEINGDSNDEDDDCCVVSATPAPDVKPLIPKTESLPSSYPPPAYPSTQPSYASSSSVLASRLGAPSTEKQHCFNWNAPDSKPAIDVFEKSADDIFESLLSNAKKENSLSDASEYISLDTLGPQHSCDVCNVRFTSLSLLDDHRRMTGHSSSLVAPSSSTLLPYNSSPNILSSLLPVKQLAEQVGKLSGMGGSGPGFTHQQNVMINIQAYPGAGGMMGPPQPYNNTPYSTPQNMHSGFPQTPTSMYNAPGQTMPGQYPGQNFMGQQVYGQQFQPQMSKPGYPGTMSPSTIPYSAASPLQSMQQAVYGQSPGMMNSQVGQMGPPGSSPSHSFVPPSSSGGMTPSSSNNVRIQNVQTFAPGQMMGPPGQPMPAGQEMGPGHMTAPGQSVGGQMPAPGPIRMAAGANITGTRPRMPTVRGARPSIRPGIHVQGQVRGAKPVRMPMKRGGGTVGGPGAKRRPDMLLPGKHDNEDCQVMSMQKQREGLPMIHSVQGAKDKLNFGSQISITKKTVNKEANAMANVLAARGISIKQKQKSRSPSPERPIPHIPNLGAGVSIKHTSKSSNFSIPEAKVGGGMLSCKICKKMFMNHNSLAVHMSNAHPQSKIPTFKCDECPASYPKSLQLQHHKRVFHNVTGPNRELGLPVVDLAQEDNLQRLSNLGIYSFIPLANREQAGGCFGIPVISVHNMQNGMTSGLQALGADGLLSLGPLKPLPNT